MHSNFCKVIHRSVLILITLKICDKVSMETSLLVEEFESKRDRQASLTGTELMWFLVRSILVHCYQLCNLT